MQKFTPAALLALFAVLFLSPARAQVVSTVPSFPTVDDSVTLIYNPALGNAALANTQVIYGHFGLIVDSPTGTGWTRTVGTWATADARTLMTRNMDGTYQISFRPRRYFGLPANLMGYRIGMVFRNQAGTEVGRSAEGSDIFLNLYQPGQRAIRITTPNRTSFTAIGQSIRLLAEGNTAGVWQVFLNDSVAASSTTASSSIQYDFLPTQAGMYTIRVVQSFIVGLPLTDSVKIIVGNAGLVAPVPSGWKDGINYLATNRIGLVLMAPQKQFVYVIGTFNDFNYDSAHQMRRTPDGKRFWLELRNLTPGTEYAYQYDIDGGLKVGDPLAEKVLDPDRDPQLSAAIYPNLMRYPAKGNGILSAITPGKAPYVWRNTTFTPPAKVKLAIYELLIRDFVGREQDKTFQGIMDTLGYLQRLGINTLQLMPVTEFEGNNSWGYNVSYHNAIDKAYGPENKLKELIDSCHSRGIAVILDVVYNHAFSQSPLVRMYWDGSAPLATSPMANRVARHPYNVGSDLNHESEFIKAYVDRCNTRLLEEFKVDGFRFDLSKGFTQTQSNDQTMANFDQSRINILTRIHRVNRAVKPNVLDILEHFAENREEIVLADSGMLFWGNLNNSYRQQGKGLGGDFSYGYFGARGWRQPNLVTYAESHDEQRLVFDMRTEGRNLLGYNTRDTTIALSRAEGLGVFLLAIPGPKMLWQFQELGYDFSINRCPNGTISDGCRTDPKPVRWDYLRSPARNRVFNLYRAMFWLRDNYPAFSATSGLSLNVGLSNKRIALPDNEGGFIILGNLGMGPSRINPLFTSTGRWYEFFTGDSIDVTSTTAQLPFTPGEYRIYSKRRIVNPYPVRPLILGIDEQVVGVANALLIQPNPASGQVQISLTNAHTQAQALLVDATGRIVKQITLRRGTATLDVSGVTPGLYLVKVGSQTQRLVVE